MADMSAPTTLLPVSCALSTRTYGLAEAWSRWLGRHYPRTGGTDSLHMQKITSGWVWRFYATGLLYVAIDLAAWVHLHT